MLQWQGLLDVFAIIILSNVKPRCSVMPSIPIYALSSKGENLSTLGSSFTYRFKTPLRIPADAKDPTISLIQSSLWYVQPNVSAALANNTLSIQYEVGGDSFDLTFQDGLYSLPALQAALKSKLYDRNTVTPGLTGDEITLIADNAQQKQYFRLKPSSETGKITINFEESMMAGFLGFENNASFEPRQQCRERTCKIIMGFGT